MMFISNGIAAVLPIPIPPSVIGLVLLFALLCTKVLKLEQVESLGTALTSLIGFLFVPSGISVMNSLGVMEKYGLPIVLVIFLATVILLAATGLNTESKNQKRLQLQTLSKKPLLKQRNKQEKSMIPARESCFFA